jgi:hypothetical protein
MSVNVARHMLSVLLLLVAVAVAVSTLAQASSETPTPSPTVSPTTLPTPSPTATPLYPQSQIRINFVDASGQPVTINTIFTGVSADGVKCFTGIPGVPRLISGFTFLWPLSPGPDQPSECTKGPPTTLRPEAGPLSVELVWTGVDTSANLLVPGAATASATPTTQALPETGGTSGSDQELWILLLPLGALLVGIFCTIMLRRRLERR